jgi:hypothetical protein
MQLAPSDDQELADNDDEDDPDSRMVAHIDEIKSKSPMILRSPKVRTIQQSLE